MDERIHKYFYEELSTEERLSLLRDVEARVKNSKKNLLNIKIYVPC